MKNLGLILSIVSLVGCGVLFAQNMSLKTELKALDARIDELGTKRSLAATNGSSGTIGSGSMAAGLDDRRAKMRERVQERQAQGTAASETRTESTKPSSTRSSSESMQAKHDLVTERITQAIDDYAAEVGMSSDLHEEVKEIVLDNMTEQHAIRLAIQSGETPREEGREALVALRERQETALQEILDDETYEALLTAMRSSRMPSRGR